jgi:predicted dehydrogenase
MKIAIIGLGMRIASVWKHLQAAAPTRLTLVGHADPAPAGGISELARFGLDGGRSFADHREMLATLRPDAVMIGSPNHLHLEHIRDSLAAGCRVFTEKPVTISPEDTWAVAKLIADAGPDRVQVGLVLRSSPFFRAVTSHLAGIGRLVSMEANELLAPAHGGFLMRDWRRKREWCGSHILEKCCHDIDLIQAICGRVARAASFGGRSIFTPDHRHLDHPAYHEGLWRGWSGTNEVFASDADIVDHQVAILETERGVRISFHVNNHAATRARSWLILGVEGLVAGDFDRADVTVQRVHQPARQVPVAANTAVKPVAHYGADEAMGADLAACWLDGKGFPVPAKAALEAGLACMAIDHAQRTGTVVDAGPWMRQLDRILPQAQPAMAVGAAG